MIAAVLIQRIRERGACILFGLAAGLIISAPLDLHQYVESHSANRYERDVDYAFISPLLFCGDTEFSRLQQGKANELEDRLTALVDKLKASGKITNAGIYFRELNNGPGASGVNEMVAFTPGSLLKVPLAISAYRIADIDPSFLKKTVEYAGGKQGDQHFIAPQIEAGKTYTVEELIRATLINSDNAAALLLAEMVGQGSLDDSYSHLGIEIPVYGRDYSSTVRDYALFFRTLYNATYLSRLSSERLLKTLSESTFTQGIVAGVPEGTVVSHKFGERSFDDSLQVQVHDCGIVYHPTQPYLICVMIRGTDYDSLVASIADISRLVYGYAE